MTWFPLPLPRAELTQLPLALLGVIVIGAQSLSLPFYVPEVSRRALWTGLSFTRVCFKPTGEPKPQGPSTHPHQPRVSFCLPPRQQPRVFHLLQRAQSSLNTAEG